MGRRLQKVNDLYDEYYEQYFAFEDMLDQARSLMQEIDDFAKEKDMIEYNHELNLLESRVVELKDMRDETDRAWVRYMNSFQSMATKLPRNVRAKIVLYSASDVNLQEYQECLEDAWYTDINKAFKLHVL